MNEYEIDENEIDEEVIVQRAAKNEDDMKEKPSLLKNLQNEAKYLINKVALEKL